MKDSYFRIIDNQLASVTLMPMTISDTVYGYAITYVAVKRPLRGKGLARELMQEVLADADKEGLLLVLEILPDPNGLTYSQLESWYTRLGFVWTTDGYMERKPRRDHPPTDK